MNIIKKSSVIASMGVIGVYASIAGCISAGEVCTPDIAASAIFEVTTDGGNTAVNCDYTATLLEYPGDEGAIPVEVWSHTPSPAECMLDGVTLTAPMGVGTFKLTVTAVGYDDFDSGSFETYLTDTCDTTNAEKMTVNLIPDAG